VVVVSLYFTWHRNDTLGNLMKKYQAKIGLLPKGK